MHNHLRSFFPEFNLWSPNLECYCFIVGYRYTSAVLSNRAIVRTSYGETKIAHEYLISHLEIKDACNKKKIVTFFYYYF